MRHKAFLSAFLSAVLAASAGACFAQDAGGDAALRPAQVEYRAEDLEDPFGAEVIEQPQEKKEEKVEVKQLPPMVIQGLIWGGALPQAIVNEKVVKVGDIIEEARVVDIRKDGLIVSFQGEEHTIPSPAQTFYPDPRKDAKRREKK
ncbi:MAG: hypothetical protein PHR11_03185 [Candidatus Omnitrophica bacterium]|nr:hypothetical protein [Candidatus Omnitrophota bacterium]